MYFEKSISSLKIKKDRSTDQILDNFCFNHFVNNFLTLLLCKITNLDIFNMAYIYEIAFILRGVEILIELLF